MNEDTIGENLQEVLSKIDKIKEALTESQSNIPISQEVVGFVEDIKIFISDVSNSIESQIKKQLKNVYDNILDKTSEVNSSINDLLDINESLNINYSKLVTKPLKLLELLHSEIKNGNNLQSELGTISNAINTLKEYEIESVQHLSHDSQNLTISISNQVNELYKIINGYRASNLMSEFIISHNERIKVIDDKLDEIYNLLGYNKEEMLKNIKNELDSEKMVEVDVNESAHNLDLEEDEIEAEEEEITNIIDDNEDFVDEIEDEITDDNDVDVDFYEDVEIEEEFDDEDAVMSHNEDYESETNPRSTTYKSKFDESYLDIDDSNEDDNDLLKYYKWL